MSAVIERTDEASTAPVVDAALHYEIADFLYEESELLDDWRFRDWLELVGEDMLYTMRSTVNAQTRDRRHGNHPPTTWIFHESKFLLERRVARLETGMAWAEEPPSRTRHFVSNLRIRTAADGDGYEARSNYLLYRSQKEADQFYYAGLRIDHLRRADNRWGWEIYRRHFTLDQAVIHSHNLSVFF